MKTVFVAMSGGVDSSVAAYLLKKKGYDVVGVFMRCWTESNTRTSADCNADKRGSVFGECQQERDAEDARRVAEHIGIPFYVWDFEEEYKRRVVDYMIEGYRQGITPNPDVMCNREIKFGLFFKRAMELGADYIATGHYVRLANGHSGIGYGDRNKTLNPIGYTLMVARDAQKDQSYFLWTLTQKQLAHCLFPIGDYMKPQVRAIARWAKLPTADKKDSQGICFLGKVDVAEFLKRHIPEKKGDIVTAQGKIIGTHTGARFYTIGQRHLGISAKFKIQNSKLKLQNAKRGVRGQRKDIQPFYVAEKDIKKNILVVAEGSENPALFRKEVILSDINFLRPVTKQKKLRVVARVRYRQPLLAASLIWRKLRIVLTFDKPVKFVAPGQSAVFYLPAKASATGGMPKTHELLGGGVIV